MLFGLIFLMPLFGAAIGAAAGALGGKLADVGIGDDFIDSVKAEVKPGTSALFPLSRDAVVDRARKALPHGHAPADPLQPGRRQGSEAPGSVRGVSAGVRGRPEG
ncbi:DUF1269 domain-containing protein [Streptomyces sp. NPDC048389]|uniref:DUF1269 domain-containing protein n=1 Tax=Streptomyces sp. NPDC048389 TaxID=3154622 RepID=UPI003451342F